MDLCELTEAVVDGLRLSAGEHELRVAVPAESDAWIDPDRVRQVLTNLISNALKYGQPGTPIVIEAADRDGFIEMTVTNQGPGIPAGELPLLFSRFGRTYDARTTGKPGTGLGLYICKGLVEAHGGRMWVDSVPGELTSFHFLLPKAPPGASAFAATENRARAGVTASGSCLARRQTNQGERRCPWSASVENQWSPSRPNKAFTTRLA